MSNLLPRVEPHALKLESIAHEMEAEGIGGDPNNGHAVILRRMAGEMRADAARGRLSGNFNAAAQTAETTRTFGVSGALRACAEVGLIVPAGNRFSSIEELDHALNIAFKNTPAHLAISRRIKIKNQLSAAGMIKEERPFDEKRVLHALKLLKAAGIEVPHQGSTYYQFGLAELNAELDKTKLDAGDRVAIKQHCLAAGLLNAADGNIVQPSTSALALRAANHILDQIGLDPPAPGRKLKLFSVNEAMAKAGLSTNRTVPMKATLAAAGFLD